MASFHISRDHAHWSWNREQQPAIYAHPGDVVMVEVTDASGGQLSATATANDVAKLDFTRVNPVTGPIYVYGAEPGDALMVEILAMDLNHWGWTAIIPQFGLLSDQFPGAYLRISQIGDQFAEIIPGVTIPVCPFIGTIGVAVDLPGDHSLIPPSRHGGNLDMRHVTPGSVLWLPVAVPGALLSIGDTHAAQGDGEVAGTAIETGSTVTVRLGLKKHMALQTPRLQTHPVSHRSGPALVTTGVGPDLMAAAQHATLQMIEWLVDLTRLDPQDAYLLTSVAGDLKISEIVDAPNWVVSMHIEQEIVMKGTP